MGCPYAIMPLVVKIYVNSACNARCLMCDIGQRNDGSVFYNRMIKDTRDTVTPDFCRRIVRDIEGMHPKVEFSGVEPLLHDEISELCGIVKKHGLQLRLVTNGILLADRAEALVVSGLDDILVSLDGLEEVNDRIRGKGVFCKAISGIRTLKKCRDESLSPTPRITAGYCITNYNFGSLVEFARYMILDEKIDSVRFTHPYFVTAAASEKNNLGYSRFGISSPVNTGVIDYSDVDTAVLWRQICKLKEEFPDRQILFNARLDSEDVLERYYKRQDEAIGAGKCLISWYGVTISANGDVLVNNRCFADSMGNLHESSLKDIWNGRKYRSYRKALSKDGPFPACVRCLGIAAK